MRRRSAPPAFGASLLAAITLCACSTPVPVDPAPYAGDPTCARVMLSVPDAVGGLSSQGTTSQATAAYGEEYPIIVRCGVEPPGPSSDPCVEVDVSGATVGWLVSEQDESWVAVAFGRSPALEVTIPKVRVDQAVRDVLAVFTASAALAPNNGLQCR